MRSRVAVAITAVLALISIVLLTAQKPKPVVRPASPVAAELAASQVERVGIVSPSVSTWSAFATPGQLSTSPQTPSPCH